jgi:hypothetical protein
MTMTDKLRKKIVKDFRALHPIYNYKRLSGISRKLNLPLWWVELLVIEYFDCRRFVENGKITIFDFGIFDESLINTFENYKVIIPSGHIFMHNIRPIDLSYRTPALVTGNYAEPLDKADLIPEGLMSRNAFPFRGNDLSVSDPKEHFNWYAIVRDDKTFYQWKIADLYEIDSKSTWFKSDLFNLLPLWKLNRRIYQYKNKISNNEGNKVQIRKELIRLFSSLKNARQPLRKKVLEYHNSRKKSDSTALMVDQVPPLLTFIDTLKPSANGYVIESHLESLFYSASLENCSYAAEARKRQRDSSLYHKALLDEIKYSALCIICSVTTLESYINLINLIFRKYLAKDSEIFERSNPQQKWLYVPHALSLPFKFSPIETPYQVFLELIKWRNKAVHHTPEFVRAKVHKSKQYKGLVSHAFGTFNFENANLAIKCEEEMILKLSEGGKISVPKWLRTKF